MQLYLKQTSSIFFIFFLFLSGIQAKAQILLKPVQDIPVTENGKALRMPWAGGLNTGLFQTADLSGNGLQELIALDRSNQSILVFSQQEGHWQASQELSCLLPAGISNWFVMQDYDGDGRKDFFTFTPAGIRVFRNSAASGEAASWELASEVLNYQTSSGSVNLLVNSSDVPAIADIDGDGDLDILAYDPSGGGGLEYYRNTSMEESGKPGLQPFVKESRRWGGLSECACGVFAFDNQPCPDKRKGSRVMHAGGKSLLLFDVDGDGDLDLLNGFEECSELYYLENTGSNTAPVFETVKTSLPGATEGVDMAYPAAFVIQGAEQAEQQLVVSPQLNRNKFKEDFSQSVWLYDIFRQDESPTYSLLTKTFLQEEMIELGETSIPAFMDLDADGDQDMIVGSYGLPLEEGFYGSLWHYENTGTIEEPSFTLQSRDYLGLSKQGFLGLSPQFIDFNMDGSQDLLLVATEPERLQRKAYLLRNQAGAGQAAVYQPEQLQEIPLFLSALESPYFYDISKDGLPDLLLGSYDGSLHYYLNNGTAQNPLFELQSKAFLGLGLDNYRRPLLPSIGELDSNGKADLLLADGSGSLRYISDFLELPQASTAEPVTLSFCQKEEEKAASWLGRRSWPVAVSLRAKEAPMLVIGNQMGGLWLVEQQDAGALPKEDELQLLIYPNPLAFPRQQVYVRTNYPAVLRMYTLSGQLVQEVQVPAQLKLGVPVGQLAAGVYLLQAKSAAGSKTQRLIILK